VNHLDSLQDIKHFLDDYGSAFLDGIRDAISIIDVRTMRIIAANRNFYDTLGFTEKEVIGRHCYAVTHRHGSPCTGPDDPCPLVAVLKTGSNTVFEHAHRHRDGHTVYMEVSVSPLKDRAGHVRFVIHVARDITERKRTEQRLRYLAFHDIITDLPNRLLFNDRFQQAILRAARTKESVAVMLMDLDRFKDVNDNLGHRIGDLLLKSIAGRFLQSLRKTDTIARLWGDEFGILVDGTGSIASIRKIARKILKVFKSPLIVEGYELKVTASLGISVYPDHGDNIEQMLRQADQAMYQAKKKGRNNFEIYSASSK
jgi:diguanylate cyclase (GGDEF)-like protein/PAS domain S-box-containing protein